MPKGGYAYIADSISLINRNTKEKYSFGDRVIVKVIKASKETSMIDFELVEKIKDEIE